MRVTYALTPDDCGAWAMYHVGRSPSTRVRFWLCWLLPPAVGVAAGVAVAVDRSEWSVETTVLLSVAAVYLVGFPVARAYLIARVQSLVFADMPDRSWQVALTLTEAGLVMVADGETTEAGWEEVTGVDVVGERTFISITPARAVILPRHGFEREADYEAVRDFALARLRHTA